LIIVPLLTRNRSENDSSTQGYEDFNTRRYPEVKSEGSRRNFTFKFGNDRRNDSWLGVKSLSNTDHAKRVTIGQKSTAKCQWWRCPSPGYHGKSRRLQVWWNFKMTLSSGSSTDLCQLPELNLIQLYDYLVVSTRKCRHIVLKGTNYIRNWDLTSFSLKETLKGLKPKPTRTGHT